MQKYGKNSLETVKITSPLVILLRQFVNLFVVILFIAAVISYFVDGATQAFVLIFIILLNVGLGFFQEYKAEKSIAELKKSYEANSLVVREGKTIKINSELIVPGDIVMLQAGDKVPADLRLLEETSLEIDESSLSGESLPADKTTAVLPLGIGLADQTNMAFGSTIVMSGHGKGIVCKTGRETEFGKIADLVSNATDTTPLEKQVAYLGKAFSLVGFVLASAIFVIGYFQGYEVWKLLTFTTALLIAVVPESLPTAITLALSIGTMRLAKKKAIVRRLAVVEALGSVNIIATDKTGTLTNNEIEINSIFLYHKGGFDAFESSKSLSNDKRAFDFLFKGLVCSNIDLQKLEINVGDTVDLAIVKKIKSIKQVDHFQKIKVKRIMEIPFDSDKKYMSVLADIKGSKLLLAKGSPEKIVDFCTHSKPEKDAILQKAEELSKEGYKVLALAEKNASGASSSALRGMNFCGLFALVDEPAEGVGVSIMQSIQAGVRPIILTGDHPETARYIANKIGLNVADDEILISKELDLLDKRELVEALHKVKVFARVTPSDKIKIVQKLQEIGFSVIVTGDGVNDAAALKEADVGVAMGIKGTDVAKDSADIILSDDRYATIISAIEYGRTIFDNIRNIIIQLGSSNFNEVMLVFAAFAFRLPLPFITIQILWINLVIESFAGLSLSFEKPGRETLRSKPRSTKMSSLRHSIIYSIYLSFASFLPGLGLYLWGLSASVSKARTLIFCYIVFTELAYALSIRSKKRIWQSPKSFIENKYLVTAVFASIFLQLLLFIRPLREIFGITTLNFNEGVVLLALVLLTFLLAEVIRLFWDKKGKSV